MADNNLSVGISAKQRVEISKLWNLGELLVWDPEQHEFRGDTPSKTEHGISNDDKSFRRWVNVLLSSHEVWRGRQKDNAFQFVWARAGIDTAKDAPLAKAFSELMIRWSKGESDVVTKDGAMLFSKLPVGIAEARSSSLSDAIVVVIDLLRRRMFEKKKGLPDEEQFALEKAEIVRHYREEIEESLQHVKAKLSMLGDHVRVSALGVKGLQEIQEQTEAFREVFAENYSEVTEALESVVSNAANIEEYSFSKLRRLDRLGHVCEVALVSPVRARAILEVLVKSFEGLEFETYQEYVKFKDLLQKSLKLTRQSSRNSKVIC